nr:hypothetical protein BaRGS_014598 [Batillaria attramentaria]
MIQKLTTTHVLNKTHFGQRDLPITKLSITHSALQDVESAAFAALISLQELDLSLLVEDLDLSENKLQHISGDALKPLASLLTRLTIAYNPIRHLNANIFSSLHQLEFLNISSCSLTQKISQGAVSLFLTIQN